MKRLLTVAIAGLLAAGAAYGAVEHRRGDNLYVSGGDVEVIGNVAGDVMAAGGSVAVDVDAASHVAAVGGRVSIAGSIRDEIWAAGGEVVFTADAGTGLKAAGGNLAIGGRIAESAYLAGANVTVTANIGEDLYFAGGNVTLAPGGNVAGRLSAAGALVTIEGHVAGTVKLAGESVVIGGRIDGNVEVEAKELRIGSTAVIGGNVDYRGAVPATVENGAVVNGNVTFEEVTGMSDEDVRVYPMKSWPEEFKGPGIAGSLVMAIAGFVSGVVFFLLFPRFVARAALTFKSRPGGSLLGGFLAVLLLPVAVVLLLISIIGIPLGIMLIFVFPVLLFAGYFIAGFGIAEWILNRGGAALPKGRRVFHYAVGVLILLVVSIVPFVGPLVIFLVVLAGIGAFLLALFGSREPPTTVPAAGAV